MLVDRQGFVDYWDHQHPPRALGSTTNSALWIPEQDARIRCEWFVCVAPVLYEDTREYWDWCDRTLRGQLLCFSCNLDDDEEWWGFEFKEDITWWSLKWTS